MPKNVPETLQLTLTDGKRLRFEFPYFRGRLPMPDPGAEWQGDRISLIGPRGGDIGEFEPGNLRWLLSQTSGEHSIPGAVSGDCELLLEMVDSRTALIGYRRGYGKPTMYTVAREYLRELAEQIPVPKRRVSLYLTIDGDGDDVDVLAELLTTLADMRGLRQIDGVSMDRRDLLLRWGREPEVLGESLTEKTAE